MRRNNGIILLVLCLLTNCASREALPPNPLYKQILKVRAGHDGLTNSYCKKYNGNTCEDLHIEVYSLKDPAIRYLIGVELGFVCSIAGKRYKVCYDKEGFCRFHYEKTGLFSKKLVETYMPLHPLEYHVRADTKCVTKYYR